MTRPLYERRHQRNPTPTDLCMLRLQRMSRPGQPQSHASWTYQLRRARDRRRVGFSVDRTRRPQAALPARQEWASASHRACFRQEPGSHRAPRAGGRRPPYKYRTKSMVYRGVADRDRGRPPGTRPYAFVGTAERDPSAGGCSTQAKGIVRGWRPFPERTMYAA